MKNENMYVGAWDKIKIVCLNHKHPRPMVIVQNLEYIKSPFYACRNYFKENLRDDELPCANRLNIDDYQGIVFKYFEILDKSELGDDLTNMVFKYRGGRHYYDVKIISCTSSEITLGIWNKTILGEKKNL